MRLAHSQILSSLFLFSGIYDILSELGNQQNLHHSIFFYLDLGHLNKIIIYDLLVVTMLDLAITYPRIHHMHHVYLDNPSFEYCDNTK